MNWLGKWLTGSNFFQCYNNGGADRATSIVAKFAYFLSLELNISRTRKAKGCPRKNVPSVSLNNSRNIHSKGKTKSFHKAETNTNLLNELQFKLNNCYKIRKVLKERESNF